MAEIINYFNIIALFVSKIAGFICLFKSVSLAANEKYDGALFYVIASMIFLSYEVN